MQGLFPFDRALGKSAAGADQQVEVPQVQGLDGRGIEEQIFFEMPLQSGELLHPREPNIRGSQLREKDFPVHDSGKNRGLGKHFVEHPYDPFRSPYLVQIIMDDCGSHLAAKKVFSSVYLKKEGLGR
jgi:hypothetical protein